MTTTLKKTPRTNEDATESEIVRRALEEIRLRNEHRLLLPEEVVAAARAKSSPLHDRFEWDDTAAAKRYRLEQARNLIRVVVTNVAAPGSDHEVRVRAYVSLTPDRPPAHGGGGKGGGYRSIAEVLSSESLRKQLLDDAMAELRSFQTKYSKLSELAPVMRAIKKLVK